MPRTIAFFELEGWEEEIIKKSFSDEILSFSKEKITEQCPPETREAEILSVFIDSRLDKAVLDYFPNVKCVVTRSTGYDHIDIAECAKRGITALFVPGYGDNTVAEFTFGLILNLTRKIYQSIDQIKETGSFSIQGLRGADIKGKTIGVIGTGRIGKEVIKIAKAFGMNVLAYDLYPDREFAVQAGFTYCGLDALLPQADIVSLHCPLTDATRHLINAANIGNMKRGAYLVNTARGPIVETEALVAALKGGTLAGAGLDVLEEEGDTKDEEVALASGHPKAEELKTILQNHILMRMPNVLVTPHNAFNSQEALGRILQISIENIKSFIAGKPVNIAE